MSKPVPTQTINLFGILAHKLVLEAHALLFSPKLFVVKFKKRY